MKKVFISHSSSDKLLADEICRLLEIQGVGCWIAPRDIAPGKSYGEEIIHGIESTSVTLLVLSDNSNRSSAVKNEIERAWSKGKTVIPVRIEDVQPSKGLEFFVSAAQWIDAWQTPMDSKISHLIAVIQSITNNENDSHQVDRENTQSKIKQNLSANTQSEEAVDEEGISIIYVLRQILLTIIIGLCTFYGAQYVYAKFIREERVLSEEKIENFVSQYKQIGSLSGVVERCTGSVELKQTIENIFDQNKTPEFVKLRERLVPAYEAAYKKSLVDMKVFNVMDGEFSKKSFDCSDPKDLDIVLKMQKQVLLNLK